MALPFASSSEIVVIGAYNKDGTYIGERTGTLASGAKRKPRYSIEIRSEPLLHNFDDMMLGAGVAEKYGEVIQAQGRSITEEASPATLAARTRASVDFSAGKPYAVARYSGGRNKTRPTGRPRLRSDRPSAQKRIGPMAPNQSRFKFNDSGRLWQGISVRQNRTDKTYTVNAPVNRLNPALFGNGYGKMIDDLMRLVPILDPRKALQNRDIENAIRASIRDLIMMAPNIQALKLKQLAAARRNAAMALLGEWFPGVTSVIRDVLRLL